MGNSSTICSDKNAIRRFEECGSPVYPTAYNSQTSSNNQSPIHQYAANLQNQQQVYKTTIPINEQQQQCAAHCSSADLKSSSTAAFNSNSNDVTNTKQNEKPLCSCFASNNALRSSHTNKNRTTNPTTTNTTTTIEYELSNGIAKLTKISSSRNAVEERPLNFENFETSSTAPTRPTSASLVSSPEKSNHLPPLLSPSDLNNIEENLQILNVFNSKKISSSSLNYQQQANYSTMADCMGVCRRDRIGLLCPDNSDVPINVTGLERLRNGKYNKGTGFNTAERQLLGIHGLLPDRVRSIEEQVCVVLAQLDRLTDDLDKYIHLMNLAEKNERLFYRVLASNVAKMMPLVYTPTVGLACQNFSLIGPLQKGLYITIKDKGHIYALLKNWPETNVRGICVTDGERILGLGDLGANGMGISIGKLALYTALAGIKPDQLLPITLDVGTNTKSLLEDPFYIGIKQERVKGNLYNEFIDEFMKAVVRRFGQHCLIQFEDFANANAFRLIAKYRDHFCTFNDDIQGTASVALAGILASLRITRTKLKDNKIVFFGAGEAALGIANLCLMALKAEGLCEEEAKKIIYMVDSRGLIVKDRPTGGITEHKARFAQEIPHIETLEEVVNEIKPTILIGAAAVGGAFTKEILKAMAEFNEKPVIFALSNPTYKAECTADDAYKYTAGRVVFASGSPFPPVEYGSRKYYPGQGNNSYIFPGVALGVITSAMNTIPEDVFYIAAKRLAELVSDEDRHNGSLYPPLKDIQCVSLEIAKEVMTYAYENGLAYLRPEPKDKAKFIRSQMYDFNYPPSFPEVYAHETK